MWLPAFLRKTRPESDPEGDDYFDEYDYDNPESEGWDEAPEEEDPEAGWQGDPDLRCPDETDPGDDYWLSPAAPSSGTEPEPPREPPVVSRWQEMRAGLAPLRAEVVGLGVQLRHRVGRIWSRRRELEAGKVLVVSGIVAAALVAASAGYLIGRGSGGDPDSARQRGELAGRQAGAIAGARKGYRTGFRKGRERAFRREYAASYRRNYRRAYSEAGLEPPKLDRIEVPRP